jgi:hypothetical protein
MKTKNLLCNGLLVLSALTATMLTACRNEVLDDAEADGIATFTATAAGNDDAGSRTEYSYAESKLAVTWSTTDSFWAFANGQSCEFSTTAGSGKTSDFTSSASIADGTSVPCVYPYSSSLTATDGKVVLDISEQKGTLANLKEVDYMYAMASVKSNKATMLFKHEVAFLHLSALNLGTANAGKAVKSLQISSAVAAAKDTLTLADGTLTSGTASVINITPPTPLTIASDGTISDVYAAFFPIATATGDFSVIATLDNGSVYYVKWTPAKVYQVGKMYKKSSSAMSSPTAYNELGAGTPSLPWLIYNATQLSSLATAVNKGEMAGSDVRLMNDIDLNSSLWTPIGTGYTEDKYKFAATFDGNGKSVTGLSIDDSATDLQGLFGAVSSEGKVKNLTVSGSVMGKIYAAGIAGSNNGLITDCTSSVTVNGYTSVGGIAGYNSGRVVNCSNKGDVTGTGATGECRVGGLVGENDNTGTITNSVNSGTIKGVNSVGGVAGSNSSNKSGITGCYNIGPVTATGDRIGGIVGYNWHSCIMGNYNIAEVKGGNKDVGGVAGISDTGFVYGCYNIGAVAGETGIGGVAGEIYAGTLSGCFSTGTLTATSYYGGTTGWNGGSGTITNCYTTTETAVSGGVNGEEVTVDELKAATATLNTAITTWNTSNTSKVCNFHFVADSKNANSGYPVLMAGVPE